MTVVDRMIARFSAAATTLNASASAMKSRETLSGAEAEAMASHDTLSGAEAEAFRAAADSARKDIATAEGLAGFLGADPATIPTDAEIGERAALRARREKSVAALAVFGGKL